MRSVFTLPLGGGILRFVNDLIREKNPDETAIVFPGKRPGLYLKRLMAGEKGRAFFPPRVFSMEGFVAHLLPKEGMWREIEYIDALYLLYRAFLSLDEAPCMGPEVRSFGDFLHIGYEILNFIDMLDMEHVEEVRLRHVQASAEIGYEVPKTVNEMLRHIGRMRTLFHKLLLQRGYLTRGLKYLLALQTLQGRKDFDFREVYFCGIFALTKVEREIVQFFWERDMATIVLEGTKTDSPILGELLESFGFQEEMIERDAAERSIRIHSCPDTHAEAVKVYEILRECEADPFGIILPDPASLFPLLTFAVERVGRPYNVTLGYPFERTPIFSLVSTVLKAQLTRKTKGIYGVEEYTSILLSPFMRTPLSKIASALEGWILKKREPYLVLSEIEGLFPSPFLRSLHRLFFEGLEGCSSLREVAERVMEILDFVASLWDLSSTPLLLRFCEAFIDLLLRLKGLEVADVDFQAEMEVGRRHLYEFLLFFAKRLTVPFETEPLEQIEVMGVLESRCLSFENLIIVDMNEGVFPRRRRVDPLIPLGVYSILGLPPPHREEEIFRYYFRRLLASARNVHLLYVESDERPRSRFIEELIWEEEKRTRRLGAVPVSTFHLRTEPRKRDELVIRKTDRMLHLLEKRRFSVSSLDEYLRCPVSFYFRELLGLRGREVIGWEIEERERGELIHSILRDTLSTLVGLKIDRSIEAILMKNLKLSIDRHLCRRTGDFYLFRRIVERRLARCLKGDIGKAEPFCVYAVEWSLEEDLPFDGRAIRITGKIDRIDYLLRTGEYLIIDYKTGQGRTNKRKIKSRLTKVEEVREHVASFQLPLYVYLFHKRTGVEVERIDARFLLLREGREEPLYEASDRTEMLSTYMDAVSVLLRHMFDPKEPIKRWDEEACQGCEFSDLCGP